MSNVDAKYNWTLTPEQLELQNELNKLFHTGNAYKRFYNWLAVHRDMQFISCDPDCCPIAYYSQDVFETRVRVGGSLLIAPLTPIRVELPPWASNVILIADKIMDRPGEKYLGQSLLNLLSNPQGIDCE